MKKRFLTADTIRAAKAGGCRQLTLEPGDVLTPLAKDLAREMGITIVDSPLAAASEASPPPAAVPPAAAAPEEPKPLTILSGNGEMEALVRQVVVACLARMGQASAPAVSTPVMRVPALSAEMQPFPFEINRPEMDVRLVDVITAQHGSPMGVGFLSFHKGSFPWTLTYDEVEFVLEGEIHIGTAQGTVVGKPGDLLFIPKGTQITFGTPGWAKILYVTYPAEWAG